MPPSLLRATEHLFKYPSIKNGIQLSSLNLVNVRVVLSASNIMRAALFCIRKPLSRNSLLQDDQIGLKYNITGFITCAFVQDKG